MSKGEEQAKVEPEEGQGESEVAQSEAEPEIVTPEAETDEGKEVSEQNWEQKYKTLDGMYKQEKAKNTSFDTLLAEVKDVGSLLKQQGETMEMHTEILSNSSELSEEAQEKVRKAREAQETKRQASEEAQQTMKTITRYAKAAGLTLEDETLKPAQEAWASGKPKEALELTVIACIGGKKEAPGEKPAEKETKETKPNLKVLSKSPPPAKTSDDMTSTEKIKSGLTEKQRKQG